MNLEKLTIERIQWGGDKGKLIGTIILDGQSAKVSLNLSEVKAKQMLEIVADSLLENAHEVSKLLLAEILNVKALEGGK